MRVAPSDWRSLALWAADCAERVLPFFEAKYPDDHRPRMAVDATRAWVRGEIRVGEAREAALAAHAAARDAEQGAARDAARAAGHAVATAHVAGHAVHAANYAVKAAVAAAQPANAAIVKTSESAWQNARLPANLRRLALSTRRARSAGVQSINSTRTP